MINILDMIADEPHDKGYCTLGVVLFANNTRAGFKKAPENWTRKEKLAYIEYIHANGGRGDKWSNEAMLSRGLSYETAKLAQREGLRLFEQRKGGAK
tara:strand:+ start:745 stop:1035 length:291 start_codon:yes stop_codon:yes gene_type:complete